LVLVNGGESGGIRTPRWLPTARFQSPRNTVQEQSRGPLVVWHGSSVTYFWRGQAAGARWASS
jgi:hypothetical protein